MSEWCLWVVEVVVDIAHQNPSPASDRLPSCLLGQLSQTASAATRVLPASGLRSRCGLGMKLGARCQGGSLVSAD